jgi:hypothetical protein
MGFSGIEGRIAPPIIHEERELQKILVLSRIPRITAKKETRGLCS